MSTPSNAMPESFADAKVAAPAMTMRTHPFYWSVRRELWEHRSVYLAPLAGAGVGLFGFLFVLVRLPHTVRNIGVLGPDTLVKPYNHTAVLIMFAAFIVSIFYALDALYGERRDRTILFWKSLPVSDLTAVFAKASIPLVVLPLGAFVLTALTQLIMLLLSSLVLLASGLSVGAYWGQVQVFGRLLMLLYHLVTAHMLWYAPLYAWLLLISAWARRAPFLWAALPPISIYLFEKIAFHTNHFAEFLRYRFAGRQDAATNLDMPFDSGGHLMLGAFLATPGLWIGLAFAVLFLYLAARLRRNREPT